MKRDLIQKLHSDSEGLELTREEYFLDGHHDIFDLLAKQEKQREKLDIAI